MSPLMARARGQDRERRAHGYRSRIPTDSRAAAASTRRFQLQQSQTPTAQHLRPAPTPEPTLGYEPEPSRGYTVTPSRGRMPEPEPAVSRPSPRPAAEDDWVPGDGSTFESADDWADKRSPRHMRVVLGALALAVIALVAVTVTRSRGGHVVSMVAALPAPLDLGVGRPTFERPAPAPTPEPSAAPAETTPVASPPERQATKPTPARPTDPRRATPEPTGKPATPTPKPAPRPEPEPTPAAELAAIIETAPTEGEHRAYITSRPAGATVILEGRVVGVTPTHVAWSGKRRQEVEVNLPGHDSSTLVLTPKASGRTLSVVLDEAFDEADVAPPIAAPVRVTSTPAPVAVKPAPAPAPPEKAPAPAKKSVLDGAFDGF